MIEVAGLTKYYGDIAAIRDVSFSAAQGEIVGFLGPNGAGKSTTMRILTGFTPASSGTARVAGFEVHAEPMEVKRRMGYLPERVPLYEEMTVDGFLRYVAEVKGVARAGRGFEVGRVKERCGLEDMGKRLISNLSKGYRQRVGLAHALIGSPPVLVLDEPTVGLDPKQIVDIRAMIRGLGGDHTVLISTHILPEVAMVCDRVVIIDRGRIVAQDSMASLSGERASLRVVINPHSGAEGVLKSVTGVTALREAEAGVFEVEGDADPAELVSALVHGGIGVRRVEPYQRTLEEIFVEAVGGDLGANGGAAA